MSAPVFLQKISRYLKYVNVTDVQSIIDGMADEAPNKDWTYTDLSGVKESDAFTGNDGDAPNAALWTKVGSPDIRGNTLEVADSESLASKNRYAHDFEITVDFNLTAVNTTNSWCCGIQVYSDATHYVGVGAAYTGTAKVFRVVYRNGSSEQVGTALARVNDTGSLKIVRTGHQCNVWVKDGAGAWTAVEATARQIGISYEACNAVIQNYHFGSNPVSQVCRFDNYALTSYCHQFVSTPDDDGRSMKVLLTKLDVNRLHAHLYDTNGVSIGAFRLAMPAGNSWIAWTLVSETTFIIVVNPGSTGGTWEWFHAGMLDQSPKAQGSNLWAYTYANGSRVPNANDPANTSAGLNFAWMFDTGSTVGTSVDRLAAKGSRSGNFQQIPYTQNQSRMCWPVGLFAYPASSSTIQRFAGRKYGCLMLSTDVSQGSVITIPIDVGTSGAFFALPANYGALREAVRIS